MFCIVLMVVTSSVALAQSNVTIKGSVVDKDGQPLIGVAVVNQSDLAVGTATDVDGQYRIVVPAGTSLQISYMGMKTQTIKVTKSSTINVTLEADSQQLEEVIVVGFGQQKKASVVGAITQVSGDVLQRSSGITDVGNALTGNLPGVITTSSTGMPGEENPEIIIRGASSWNSSAPLILIDGIERPLSSVDVNSIANISVLKDASATAVYGVKGANGVILVTTKRGEEGRAKINVSFNSAFKTPSQLPEKYDSYDALSRRNYVIEHELGISPSSWGKITPENILLKYRYPANLTEAERYPNVNWEDEIFDDFAMSYNLNVNASGGSKKFKYFAGVDYQYEGDLFKEWSNGRGYNTEFSYQRINARTNLDYEITPTTKFSLNLAGSIGIKNEGYANYGNSWEIAQAWGGVYGTPPNAFLPMYSDGSYGYYPEDALVRNPITSMILKGDVQRSTITLNSDFVLVQDLKFITKGLSARGTVSWDNIMYEMNRGIKDENSAGDVIFKYVYPDTGNISTNNNPSIDSGFDYIPGINWSADAGYSDNDKLQRRLSYSAQINYARKFDKHDVTAMGAFNRQEHSVGSRIPYYREDWVYRMTYNYDLRYFIEYNGAYNGSEKFNVDNRFGFFQSGAAGWTITEENFMKPIKDCLSMLKLRVSYGEIGDDNDNYSAARWLYATQWAYGGATVFYAGARSPYTYYRESAIGNPDIHWETVRKLNYGVDFSLWDGLLAGSVDIFRDHRFDILIMGDARPEPSYFGAAPPAENLGEMKTRGYEFELRFNKTLSNDLRLWANASITHAENIVIKRADPDLKPDYQKAAGYALGQNTSYISSGYINNYDELYGSPNHDINNSSRLPGDYNIIDFNCDGVIDTNDKAPNEYTGTPQNTFNAIFGFDYHGWNFFAQFYGVNNVSRYVNLASFSHGDNVYNLGSWWSAENPDAHMTSPRYYSSVSPYSEGTQYLYDGSFIRLKNVELGYTFNKTQLNKIGLEALKLYVNGNNLWLWTRMPDDRESNYAGSASTGAYPTMRRFNLGCKLTF